MSNIVSVNKNVTNVITVTAQGPQGIQGVGFNSSSYTTTSSFNSSTGSFAVTGSNTFIGNQTITGSLNVSGSINATDIVYCEYSFNGNYTDGSNQLVNIPGSITEHPNFILNTGGIKVLSAGIYKVSITLRTLTSVTGTVEMGVNINGNFIKSKFQQISARDESIDISCIISLVQDDVIYLYIYPSGNTSTTIQSVGTRFDTANASWISVEKLN